MEVFIHTKHLEEIGRDASMAPWSLNENNRQGDDELAEGGDEESKDEETEE